MLYDPIKFRMPEVPVRESETVEVLKAARARIMQGWCSDGGTDEKGGVCIIVAISRQTEGGIGSGVGARAFSYFEGAIQPPPKYSNPLSSIFDWFDPPVREWAIDWNERPGRTQAEVVDAFTRAIELARADA
jgi:hypothetical protein